MSMPRGDLILSLVHTHKSNPVSNLTTKSCIQTFHTLWMISHEKGRQHYTYNLDPHGLSPNGTPNLFT